MITTPLLSALRRMGGALVVLAAAIPALRAQLNYQLQYIPNNYETLSSPTLIHGATLDDATASIPLPFNFTYAGFNYTTSHFLRVCVNGFAVLNTTSGTTPTTLTNQLGNNTVGNFDLLAPWWDDLHTRDSGQVRYQVLGTAPNRRLIVDWSNVRHFTPSTAPFSRRRSFQIKLFETTNVIEFHYSSDIGAGPLSTGESASIGIRNATGGENNFIDAITGSRIITSGSATTDQYPQFGIRFTPGSILPPIAGGTYTVGSGGDWPSLTEAIAQLNHRGMAGPITLNLIDPTYSPAAAHGNNIFPLVIGPITSATNTLTIQSSSPTLYRSILSPGCPNGGGSGVYRAIGTTATALSTGLQEGIIHLAGADYVTVRRISFGIPNASQIEVSRAIVVTNASSTDGATNNLFENFDVALSRNNTSSFAIDLRAAYAPTSAAGANSNNKFYNYNISNVYSGITVTGNASFPDQNNEFGTTSCTTFNTIGSTTLGDIGGGTPAVFGIQVVSGQQNLKIYNHIIRNLTNSSSATNPVTGISALLLHGTSEIYNNHVYQLSSLNPTSTTPVVTGITATTPTTGTHTVRIYNNMVGGLINAYTGAASSTRNVIGLSVGSNNASATYQVHFNSVRIENTNTSSNTAFQILNNTSVHNVRNNIFANFTGAQSGAAVHYAMAVPFTTFGGAGSVSNNNVLYVANATNGHYGLANTTNQTTFANWQSSFGGVDGASVAGDPNFSSGTDLHLSGTLAQGVADMTGITWVTTDFDCDTRSAPHWAGADAAQVCSGTPNPGTLTAFPNTYVCVGNLVALQVSTPPTGLGITYNWEVSTDGGLTWTSFSTSPPPISWTAPAAGTYQFRVTATCSYSSQSGTSTIATVGVISGICQCSPYPSNYASLAADEDIGSVTVGAMTNTSTCSTVAPGPGSIQNRYSNYTTSLAGPSANLGDNVNFSVDVITCGGNFGNGIQIYVDWNQDGDFLDAGEQVYNQPVAATGPHTKSGSFTVPLTATVGTTRMRVVAVETAFPTATNYAHTAYTWGETEDYCFTVTTPPPCTGTPAPGNTTASQSVGCNGNNITLNFTGSVTGTGLTYNWEYSTDGGVTWNSFSSSPPPVTYTFGTQTTQFRCTVTCTNSGQSGTSTPVTVTAGGPCYCAAYCSAPHTFASQCITNVTINTLNNTTPATCALPSYSLESATTTLLRGTTYTFSMTSGTGAYAKVWFDWNGDATFAASEGFTVYDNAASGSINVTVPLTAALGEIRMRVRTRSVSYALTDACVSFASGETEDYCITIADPPPCTGTPAPGNTTASQSVGCNGNNITLNFTGSVTGTGLTYNWEYSTDGGVTWNSFSSSPPPVTYTFGTQTTQFRCTVTCTNSGQSGTSTPVTVTAGGPCYCAAYCSAPHTFASQCITNVTINTLNNTTPATCALPSYSLESATTTLLRGTTYTFSMTSGTGAYAKVWFDWNGDATFAASEGFTVYDNAASGSINVTVPLTAALGEIRMRVRTRSVSYALTDACVSFGSGETEDYCITIADPPPCSGTPAPGATTASTTAGCTGSPVTLNLTGSLAFTGLSYNWEASTDGGATWTSFSTSPPPVNYTYGTAPVTQLRCVVTCTNSGQSATSTPVTVTLGGSCVCATYGASSATSASWGDITSVTFNSYTNAAPCTTTAPGPGSVAGMYSNYTTIAGPLFVTGSTVNFSVQLTNCTSGTYSYHLNIYVDWNADGDFVDAGEAVYVSTSATSLPFGSPQTITGSFVVPVSATLGNTRMRVITKEVATNDITPTGTYTWGETEDYCVTVAPPTCTWTGAVPAGPVWGSWHVAGNWDCGYVPTITTDVVIPNTAPVMPAIVNADGNARNVTMQNGTQIFIVSSSRRLNVANDWSAGTGTGAAVNYGPGSVRMLASDGLGQMTGNTGFHTLDIHAGTGTVTITSGSVRVRNAVQLRSGTLNTLGNLTLESLLSPAHTAGIIDNFSAGFTGTMVGNVKAERRIPRWNPIFFGSPVNNGTVADIAADVPGGLAHNGIGGDGSNFVADPTCTYMSPSSPWARLMQYDESTVTTCAFNGWQIRLSGTTQNGRGYMLHQVTASVHPTYDFTGIANTGAITANVTRTAANTTANQGVNLLSNPYPSGINLDAFYAANSAEIGTMAYLYNGTTFVTVNMNDGVPSHVASFQGFQVVKSAVGTGTVTFNQSMRVVGNTLAFTDAMAVPHKLEVVVTGRDAEHRDETVVYFGEGLKDGFDLAEDGYKFYSAEGYPTLYTMAEGTAWPVSVNGLNVQTAVTEVPLGLSPGAAGRFVFTVRGGDRLPAGMTCYLVDKVEKKEVKVGEETSYVFDINGVETRDRFVLRFRRDVPVEVQPVVQQPQREVKSEEVGVEADRAWTQNNRIYLSLGRDVPGRLTLRLMDMSGKVVWTDALQNAVRGVYDLGELEVSSGLYILNWSDGRSTQSARLALGLTK